MINNTPAVNRSVDAAAPSERQEMSSQHLDQNQFAATNAALMIGGQYSHASKSQFRRECLDYLKASLAPAQDVPA